MNLTISLVGAVNSGKSSIFDKILKCNTTNSEVGHITQCNKVITISKDELVTRWPKLDKLVNRYTELEFLNLVDTPGHNLFEGLKIKSVKACNALVVVFDITQKWQQHCTEYIRLAKAENKPIIIALNKIDKIVKINSERLKEELQSNDKLVEAVYSASDLLSAELSELNLSFVTPLDGFRVIGPDECYLMPVSALLGIGISELVGSLIINCIEKKAELIRTSNLGYLFEVEWSEGETWYTIFSNKAVSRGLYYYLGSEQVQLKKIKVVVISSSGKISEKLTDEIKYGFFKCITSSSSNFNPGTTFGLEAEELKEVSERIDNEKPKSGVLIKCINQGELEAISAVLEQESVPIWPVAFGVATESELFRYNAVKESNEYYIVLCTEPKLVRNISGIVVISDSHLPTLLQKFKVWLADGRKIKLDKEKSIIFDLPAIISLLPGHLFKKSPLISGVRTELGTLHIGERFAFNDFIVKVVAMQRDSSPISKCEVGTECAVELKFESVILLKDFVKIIESGIYIQLNKVLKSSYESMKHLLSSSDETLFEKARSKGWK